MKRRKSREQGAGSGEQEAESSKLQAPSRSTQTRYRDPQLTHWIAGRYTPEEKAFLENAVALAGPEGQPRRKPLGFFAEAGRFSGLDGRNGRAAKMLNPNS